MRTAIALIALLALLVSCGGGGGPSRTSPLELNTNGQQNTTPPEHPESPEAPQEPVPTFDSIGFSWEALEGEHVLQLLSVYPMEIPDEEWIAANPLQVSFERPDDGSDDVLMHLPSGSRWGIGSTRDAVMRLRHVSTDHVMWGCGELSFEYVLYWWADRSSEEAIRLQYWDFTVYLFGGVPTRSRNYELYSWEGGRE